MNYLHPELPQRSKLYLIKNEFCNLKEKLGEISIESIDENLAENNKNYIKIVSLKVDKDTKILKLSYPVEGAMFIVKLDKNDKVINVEVIEK